jgi:hypothetical protein
MCNRTRRGAYLDRFAGGRRTRVGKIATFAALVLAGSAAHADLNSCGELYVGSVLLEKGIVPRVVFLNSPGDTSGSYFQWFGNGWTPEETKMAVALLMSAKIAGHRVDITTNAPNGCSIATNGYYLQRVYLSTHY